MKLKVALLTHDEARAIRAKSTLRKQVKEIRAAINNAANGRAGYVYGFEARGYDARIINVKVSKGVLYGLSINSLLWFPITKWEVR
jgi:hypothetical protein